MSAVLSFNLSETIKSNKALVERLIADNESNQYIKKYCTNDLFLIDPIGFMIHEMITRGLEEIEENEADCATSIIIGKIPNFIEKACSLDYLKNKHIERLFLINIMGQNIPLLKIMKTFEKSVLSVKFQNDLKQAVEAYNDAKNNETNFYEAEKLLRRCYTVFISSTDCEEYDPDQYRYTDLKPTFQL